MKRKVLGIIIVFLLITNISSIATLSYNKFFSGSDECPDYTEDCDYIHEQLNLSGVQNSKLKTCNFKLKCNIQPIRDSLLVKQRILINILKKDNPDLSEINKAINEITKLQSNIQKNIVSNLLEWKKVLTPQQEEKFISLIYGRLTGSENQIKKEVN